MSTRNELDNPHAAEIYRAIALRFYSRYTEARRSADHRGGDLLDHGPLSTESDADECYKAAADDCVVEAAGSADAALALVHFAGVIAADRLIGEVTQEPVNDERDAYHQARALANVAGWINKMAISEFVEQHRAKRGGGDLRTRLDAIFADTMGAAYETADNRERLLSRMVEIFSQGKEAQG